VHQLGLHEGQTLLINGVGGGVGVAAAQIARGLGLNVVGTASAGKQDFVESLGVTHVTYGDGATDRVRAAAPDGVDAIYDLVGGDALRSVGELVEDRSKLVTAVDPATVAELGGSPVARARNSQVLEAVAELVAAGSLDPKVTEVLPFEQAGEALALVESGHARGKVVLEIA